MAVNQLWTFAFGLLGNIISFMVFLAPLPTFYKIYKKKSTEGFQSLPYVVALFSSTLWIYYAMLKDNVKLLITINSIGCVIESIYIVLFLFYATKKARILTVKILLLLNVFGFGSMLLLTHFLIKENSVRANVLGWICLVFNLCVFAAPLCIMKKVVSTKSVEFMPFSLSFFLTLGAVTWFFYGLLLKDYYIALPNIVGFVFGIIQMVLYAVYKNTKKARENPKLQEISDHIIDVVKLSTIVCPEQNHVIPHSNGNGNGNGAIETQTEKEKTEETKKGVDNV